MYQYQVKNRFNELEEYSREYKTREDAIKWYNEHGTWLENKFNRVLVLTKI